MAENQSLRVAYGETLVKTGSRDPRVVVLDADLAHATMTSMFQQEYADRFFNLGIAEANMVCAATGFAHSGLCVGEDGGSHQAIEDIGLMRALPGMTVLVPCDPIETKKAVQAALDIEEPVYIRVARPVCGCITQPETPFVPGKANVLRQGTDIALFATGLMVEEALKAAALLEQKGISAAVVNFHTIKPYDAQCALEWADKTNAIVTVEEHSVIGGLASATTEALMGKTRASFAAVGIEDKFGRSGKPGDLFREYGLTAENIVSKGISLLAVR